MHRTGFSDQHLKFQRWLHLYCKYFTTKNLNISCYRVQSKMLLCDKPTPMLKLDAFELKTCIHPLKDLHLCRSLLVLLKMFEGIYLKSCLNLICIWEHCPNPFFISPGAEKSLCNFLPEDSIFVSREKFHNSGSLEPNKESPNWNCHHHHHLKDNLYMYYNT